jgi:5-methylcytosine-specific restriction endonuclease McrA
VPGAWEADHIFPERGNGIENCRILCIECHKNTPTYGTGKTPAVDINVIDPLSWL